MDLRKIRIIALKDLQILFSDRNLLVLMFATPITLTVIIAGALSGFTSNSNSSSTIRDIPVAIANDDGGTILLQPPTAANNNAFVTFPNFGAQLVDILVPTNPAHPANKQLAALIKAKIMSRADAIAQVKAGRYVAAILIPPGFSRSLNPLLNANITPTEITVYRDAGETIYGGVVSSVVRGIVNNLSTNFIAFYAVRDAGIPLGASGDLSGAINTALKTTAPIRLTQTTVTGEKVNPQGGFNALQYFAPAMAIFFVMFTTNGAASSILEEQSRWTLQRLAVSPTTRSTILAGKLGGTYISGLAQLSILIVAMAILGAALSTANGVWGTNIVGIVLVTLTTALAACGIGVFIAGIARTATQADTTGSLIVTFSGMLGGAFFPVASLGGPLALLSKLTINYWATNAYAELARSNNLIAVLPNIAALLAMFAVFFTIGTVLFDRRLRGVTE